MTETLESTSVSIPSVGDLLKFAWRNALVQVGWPQGPALLVSAVGLALVMSEVTPLFGTTRAVGLQAISVVVLAASALWFIVFFWNVLIAAYRIQKNRAERAEAELRATMVSAVSFDAEQLQRVLARYYGSAHTFLYFDMAANVSLSQNVRAVEVHSPYELTIHFLQALDPASILVRPLGGTPRLTITSAKNRSLRIQLHHPCTFVRVRIFGDIVPAIKNHGPNSEASEAVLEPAGPYPDWERKTRAVVAEFPRG